MGIAPVNLKVLGNVSFIVLGVIIASYGEIKFVMTGFLFQLAGVAFEATRLVMVQKLLSSAEFKMDPLVSLYYFAPACAVMNGVVSDSGRVRSHDQTMIARPACAEVTA